jgi:hypothetical protein
LTTTSNPINTTLSRFQWAITKASMQGFGIAYSNGYYSAYSWSNNLNAFQYLYCPANSQVMNYYYVNQKTGEILYPSFQQKSFNVLSRPYYTTCSPPNSNGQLLMTTIYGSVSSNTLSLASCKGIYTPSGTFIGVIQASAALAGLPNSLPTFSQYLSNLNIDPATVVYVYQTSTNFMLVCSLFAYHVIIIFHRCIIYF